MIKKIFYLLFCLGISSFFATAYARGVKSSLLIIRPKECATCNTERMVNFLKKQFPQLTVSYLDYPDAKADKLVREFAIAYLPAYLLGKETEKEKNFKELKKDMEIKGNFYMLKPQFSGFSYFVGRKKIKGRLDFFLSLYDKNAAKLLDLVREFNPYVHFLTIERQGAFEALKGHTEAEDYLGAVCVQKYYPQDFWRYISCRAKNINSSWWDACAEKMDSGKIKNCALGQEGMSLLRENISLNKELRIMFGPTYLLDNQEVFSSKAVPTKEELEKVIKR